MNMSITKRNFLSYLTILTLVGGGLGALVLHYLEPGHYFGGYPLIPVYFYIFGVFYIYMFDACRRHAPDKMVMLFDSKGSEDDYISLSVDNLLCGCARFCCGISADISGILSGLPYI